jgi:transcriptional regulator with XRE-family HTH domain
MAHKRISSHVRTYRKRSGLTQLELANLLGQTSTGRVSRHERGITIPSLPAALGYEAIFGVPILELFPAIHETVGASVEARLAALKSALGEKSVKDRDANATALKLEFISARKIARQI